MCDVFYSLRHLAAKRFPSKCSFKKSNNKFGNDIQSEMLIFSSYLTGIVKIFVFFPRVLNLLPYQLSVLVLGQTVCYSKT